MAKGGDENMTFLDCSVTGCVYNADRCCCKGDIRVEGDRAKSNRDTCCGSFKERTAENASNVAKRISKFSEVECDACNCVFNEAHKCEAEHIGIAGGDACECRETECASFCCCE